MIPGGCRICGGTAGDDRQVAHTLCMTRVDLGEPTPSLGNACPCCGGSGNHPSAELRSNNGGQDAIERQWAPSCKACNGSGAIDVADIQIENGHRAHAKTILHWCGTCRAPASWWCKVVARCRRCDGVVQRKGEHTAHCRDCYGRFEHTVPVAKPCEFAAYDVGHGAVVYCPEYYAANMTDVGERDETSA